MDAIQGNPTIEGTIANEIQKIRTDIGTWVDIAPLLVDRHPLSKFMLLDGDPSGGVILFNQFTKEIYGTITCIGYVENVANLITLPESINGISTKLSGWYLCGIGNTESPNITVGCRVVNNSIVSAHSKNESVISPMYSFHISF